MPDPPSINRSYIYRTKASIYPKNRTWFNLKSVAHGPCKLCFCPTKSPSVFFRQKRTCPSQVPTCTTGLHWGGERKNPRNSDFLNLQSMRKATQNDKQKVVNILLEAFKKNQSVNYVAGREEKKIRFLMEYSFDSCMDTGEIFISTTKTPVP